MAKLGADMDIHSKGSKTYFVVDRNEISGSEMRLYNVDSGQNPALLTLVATLNTETYSHSRVAVGNSYVAAATSNASSGDHQLHRWHMTNAAHTSTEITNTSSSPAGVAIDTIDQVHVFHGNMTTKSFYFSIWDGIQQSAPASTPFLSDVVNGNAVDIQVDATNLASAPLVENFQGAGWILSLARVQPDTTVGLSGLVATEVTDIRYILDETHMRAHFVYLVGNELHHACTQY